MSLRLYVPVLRTDTLLSSSLYMDLVHNFKNSTRCLLGSMYKRIL
ncbi:unnamed protein product [Brassica napus]|uniref:(rape) hypothetical protein n=1 Tax=Brassica napus TaxID=3708 RepID=A0A816L238_BRANA|nr:unnamed protein product [Brassica napus]